jgi:hypothetical protein
MDKAAQELVCEWLTKALHDLQFRPESASKRGQAMKTFDAAQGYCGKPREIKPSLRKFESLLAHDEKALEHE